MLDLDQRALARLVGAVRRLGNNAIEPRPLEAGEPVVGNRPVSGGRSEVDDTVRRERIDEQRASLGHWTVEERLIVAGQDVERDERSGGLGCQPVNPRLCRMDPLQQSIEVESVARHVGDDDLAIDDASGRQRIKEWLGQFGEVSPEWLEISTDQFEPITVAKDDAAEPVPLRFEDPSVPVRDLACQFRQHRLDGRLDGKVERHVCRCS